MSLFLLIFFPLMGGVVALLCKSGVLIRGRAEELEGSSLLVSTNTSTANSRWAGIGDAVYSLIRIC